MGSKTSDTTSTTSTALPASVQKGMDALLGSAGSVLSRPLVQYGGSTLAGFTADQNQGMQQVRDAQGSYLPYLNTASQYATQGAKAITPMQFSGDALQQYMNPYQQSVIDSTMGDIYHSNSVAQNDLLGRAIQSGASPFGGDRAGVAAAELARGQAATANSTLAGLNQSNYNNALSQFNTQQSTDLAAQQDNANRSANAASQFSGLGSQLQDQSMRDSAALINSGQTQQALGQTAIDQAKAKFDEQQAYPLTQLQNLSNLITGVAGSAGGTTTTTNSAPSGNGLSQILGAATAILPLVLKDGGAVHMADGGIATPMANYDQLYSRAAQNVNAGGTPVNVASTPITLGDLTINGLPQIPASAANPTVTPLSDEWIAAMKKMSDSFAASKGSKGFGGSSGGIGDLQSILANQNGNGGSNLLNAIGGGLWFQPSAARQQAALLGGQNMASGGIAGPIMYLNDQSDPYVDPYQPDQVPTGAGISIVPTMDPYSYSAPAPDGGFTPDVSDWIDPTAGQPQAPMDMGSPMPPQMPPQAAPQAPQTFYQQSAAPQPGMAPAPAQGGLAGLWDRMQTPDAKHALLRAGLGMMMSKDPNALAGIASGALQGVDYYDQQKAKHDEEAKDAAKQAKMDAKPVIDNSGGTIKFIYSDGRIVDTGVPTLEGQKFDYEKLNGKQVAPTDDQRELVQINQERKANGLPPMGLDEWITTGKKAGATNVNVNSGGSEYDKTTGKALGDMDVGIQTEARQATTALGTLDRVDKIMKDPNFYSGAGADQVKLLKKGIVALGGDPKSAASMEEFQGLTNKMVLDAMGGSLGAGISNADRSFVTEQAASLDATLEGNKQRVDMARALAQRKLDVAKLARDYKKAHDGHLDDGFTETVQQFAEQHPLFKDADSASRPPTQAELQAEVKRRGL